MFLRCHARLKDGKEHRYYSVEESRRVQSGKVVQRRVLYLGEINGSHQAAWRKTLEVFDERQQRPTTLSLFPEDRPVARGRPGQRAGEAERDAVAARAALRQLLAGLRDVAATGARQVLGAETAAGAREGELGARAAVAGREPPDRARQRVSSAP